MTPVPRDALRAYRLAQRQWRVARYFRRLLAQHARDGVVRTVTPVVRSKP